MLYALIEKKINQWIDSNECTVKNLIDYMENKGKLRDAQFNCVKTFLFLKLYGKNKPLWQLMFEGAFNTLDIEQEALTRDSYNYLTSHPEAQALYEYAKSKNDFGQSFSPNLVDLIAKSPSSLDYKAILKTLFGKVSYADYIFSIPMGAGKTWLMAMFVYLNLYFAINEPTNKAFAHNFVVVAPAGLKSSIIPSLKDMKDFDPTFILPEDEALRIKRIVRYEVLEDSNSSKGSNIVKNPNAVKVQSHQPFDNLMGLVLITNIEKLYDKIDKSDQINDDIFETLPEEEKKKWIDVKLANELREIIGELPGLCIMIDEVQHAKTEELLIVKVVNKWAEDADLNSVLGFSGTPYFSKPDSINICDSLKIKLEMFGNVATYYPLSKAVGNFLKYPRIRKSEVSSEDIIRNGIEDFLINFGNTVYPKVGAAKLAIYCDRIDNLEENIYPLVCSICREHDLDPETIILRYYGSDSKSGYRCPPTAQADFRALDTLYSKHRIVLLVQIGKEGWNCKSLTSVILPMPNPSIKNKVLQTSCRCLREVVSASEESALIWLSQSNYVLLDNELKKNHHSSIEKLTNPDKPKKEIKRYSRQEVVNLPLLHYYQFDVKYRTIVHEDNDIKHRLLSVKPQKFIKRLITESDIQGNSTIAGQSKIFEMPEPITFNYWLSLISKESFGLIAVSELRDFTDLLTILFDEVTIDKNGITHLNPEFKQKNLRSDIRKCFTPVSKIQCTEESIPRDAALLKIEPLLRPYYVTEDRLLSPAEPADVEKVIAEDNPKIIPDDTKKAIEALRAMGLNSQADDLERPYLTKGDQKDRRTYQYIPYTFDSGFESSYYSQTLRKMLEDFTEVEIYYNGDESLTDFYIECYTKTTSGWKRIPNYVPDFLILKRDPDTNKISKVIIAETKGTIYEESFKPKKDFMDKFITINRNADNETLFDFLYLPERLDKDELFDITKNRIETFLIS